MKYFELWCSECHEPLTMERDAVRKYVLRVLPCKHCTVNIEEIHDSAYDAGCDDGYTEGRKIGIDEGEETGYEKGYEKGYNEGHANGRISS